ncbi:MAG: histidine kinase N-terminal 7TM domain-containing protein [Eubacteriales bacterium]|nr:histidine kinase N-terminal 7TM domain-containing protein [Eubacteriales bacterium]
MSLSSYTIIASLSAIIILLLFPYLIKRRGYLGLPFPITIFLIFLWITSQIIELNSITFESKIFWANIQYIPIMFYLLFTSMKDKRGIYGKQIYFFSISIFLPILANIYNLSGLNNLGFDLTPLVFGISGLIIYFGIIKYQIFDMVPIARSYIVDQIKSGVVVTDRTGKIVDINKAGLKIFNFKNEKILVNSKPMR